MGGEATAVSGLPGSCVTIGAAGRGPAGQLFLQLLHRLRELRERAAFRKLEGVQLRHDVLLVFRQLRREIDQLPGEHPARRAERR